MSDDILISASGLSVGYRIGKGLFQHSIPKAVDDVSVQIGKARSWVWRKRVRQDDLAAPC